MTALLQRNPIRHAAPLLAAFLALAPAIAAGQTTIPNPLRGKPVEKIQDKPPEKAAEPAPEAKQAPRSRSAASPDSETKTDAKPRRERSAKQKENDEIMRACGASWRADKDTLQANGQTWRNYLKDCRAKRRGEQKA